MNIMEFIGRFFGKESVNSKDMAKDRLRLVLVHDRINMSPQVLEALKEDLIKVINKYMENRSGAPWKYPSVPRTAQWLWWRTFRSGISAGRSARENLRLGAV